MRLGGCVHQLADFDQTFAFLDAFDRNGHQRFAIAAVWVAIDALGYFHAAQAGAILFARQLEDGLFLSRSQGGKIDGAELVGGLPGGRRSLRERGCAEDDGGEIDSHVIIIAQTPPSEVTLS